MSTTTVTRQYLTTGQTALHFRVPLWQVLALFKRGFLEEPARVGYTRSIPVDDLPRVRAALQAAGYLAEDAPVEEPQS